MTAVLTARSGDRIRIGYLNLEHDGGPEPEPGVLPKIWHQTYDLLASLDFDWLGLGELTYSQTRPDATEQEKKAANRRWRAARQKTGMRGFRAAMGQGNNPVGLLVRESAFTISPDAQQHLTKVFRTPPAVVELGLREVPEARILTAAIHASYCNPLVRRAEAFELTSLADKVKAHRHGGTPVACWQFGDTNELPVPSSGDVPDRDWNSPDITDRVHRRHRARKMPDGTWRSRTDFDEIMLDCGMHDPARYAARRLDKPTALATPTAGLAASAAGQGGPCRIDRGAMDAWSIQAVTDVQVIDLDGKSDHNLLIVDCSRRKLVEGLHRTYQPLADWELMV
ncbi:endonuclease/exonuclease/phosphatase family protein [Streptomyces flaveolus]|uniref:endonuclease/exonuclease/phosphatase family protein n=1 Tax=Streptomyces flaveolus TaxID=67297 RepID=UPI0033B4A46F